MVQEVGFAMLRDLGITLISADTLRLVLQVERVPCLPQ
jgi:hypothetical protein